MGHYRKTKVRRPRRAERLPLEYRKARLTRLDLRRMPWWADPVVAAIVDRPKACMRQR